jgi:hypothetical protein
MSETQPPRRTLRSVGAVLAGLVAIVVLSNGTDAVLHATGVFPPFGQPMSDTLFVLAMGYRIVYGVATSYLVARLAPDRPMRHALAFGVVGVVFSVVGAAATWGRGPEFGPKWYALAVVAMAIPCAWAGGKLFDLQMRASRLGIPASRTR